MRRHQRTAAALAAAALAVLGALAAGGAAQTLKPKDQARVYEEALAGMAGQPYGKVIAAIEDWKFECLDAWQAADPAPKDVTAHNRNKIKFSKKEIAEIFGPAGAYRVVVYTKLVGTDATTMGGVDAMGMTAGKDATFTIEKYTVIRAVFRDNALVLSKVWPVMDQSGMSGGMLFRR
jgi:hypothetical protein